MPWAHWSLRDLQSEIETIAPGLLERLEVILPALKSSLQGFDAEGQELYSRSMLVKALRSFTPDDRFGAIEYRRYLLDRLPPPRLAQLGACLGSSAANFDVLREQIVERSWISREQQLLFLSFFGLSERFASRFQSSELSFEDVQGGASPSTNPRLMPYQEAVWAEAARRLTPRHSRLLIQMPTGSGKTRTAMELVVELLRDQQESPVVFWLAHSEELCRQAFETFVRLWEHSEDRSVRACRLWGHHETPTSVDKPLFIAAGFQKLVSLTATGDHPGLNALRSRTMLVVVDEAHRSVAPTYKRVIDYLIARGAKLIGLSATPGRSTEHEMEKLFGLYFGSIVGIKAPSGTSVVRFLQEQRVLSRIQTDSIISPVSFSLSPRELRYLETNLDFPAEFLNRVGRNDVRNAEILARVIGECRAGRRVVSFACNLEHSRFLANVLSFLGFSAAHIDGNTDRAARQHIVRQFRDGQLQVISNYGVLSTGFDAPNADVVLIARPTRSAILYSQMIGRGLRGPAMGGSEICRLLDVRDNIENIGPIDLLYSEFAEYWCE